MELRGNKGGERLPHLLEAFVLVLQEGASGGVGLLDHLPHLLVDNLGQVLAVCGGGCASMW